MQEIIILLAIGAIGGALRSVLGYETQSDDDEPFNFKKAAKSTARAAIGGASLVMGTMYLTGGAVTDATYVLAFFAAVGIDVISKEGTATIRG